MTDHYAVFGNPIAHSKSPQIHAAFAKQTLQDLRYERQLVEPGNFTADAKAFFDTGGKGLNITVPFKLDAYAFAGGLTQRAQQAQAVNTLALQNDGSVLGDNTDGAGLLSDITTNLRWQLRDKKILVLGAGGAVRGVLAPLLSQRPQRLVIANRTASKAIELADAFSAQDSISGGSVRGCGYEQLGDVQFDIVINGTSASLAGDLPPLPENLLSVNASCYDMMYGAKPTVFMQWAQQHGAAHIADGLGMLVEQAAAAFQLWRGVRPQTAGAIIELRAAISKP
jgi:shikimate dehydrogenase